MTHLHLDEVEDLLLALRVCDLIQLLRQAAQHGAAAGLVDGRGCAGVRALVHNGVMARDAQPVVQPAQGLMMRQDCCARLIWKGVRRVVLTLCFCTSDCLWRAGGLWASIGAHHSPGRAQKVHLPLYEADRLTQNETGLKGASPATHL